MTEEKIYWTQALSNKHHETTWEYARQSLSPNLIEILESGDNGAVYSEKENKFFTTFPFKSLDLE